MRYSGIFKNDQGFFNDMDEYFDRNYLHVRSFEWMLNGMIRIVFNVNRAEFGYVLVKGYDYYQQIGNAEYCKYLDEIIHEELQHLHIFKENIETYQLQEKLEKQQIIDFIGNDDNLRKINSRRTRNFTIYKNSTMEVVYDTIENELNLKSSIPFSDIEHDTNRKYTEQVCKEIMLDYRNNKKEYIRMLTKSRTKKYRSSYKKYVSILKGEKDFSDDDILVMISILGRLKQENQMGPISVMKDEKLNPNRVVEHTTTKQYIVSCVNTIKEYSNYYLQNNAKLRLIGGMGFDGLLDKQNITPNPIPILTYNQDNNVLKVNRGNKIKGNALSPHYISSFLNQLVSLKEFKDVPIMLDEYKDIIRDLVDFSKRYRGGGLKEISALGKVKSILLTEKFEKIMNLVDEKINKKSKLNTYYKVVSKYLLEVNNEFDQKLRFYTLVQIFEKYINDELSEFMEFKEQAGDSKYSNCDISISSDMHFNSLDNINRSNYSNNFNIIAGDFCNNLFHRGGLEIKKTFLISGIGVLGNHDVYWLDSIEDIGVEVITNYQKSIEVINEYFPTIKILNNEVYYQNGVAFVGLTIVADEDNHGNRSFFANTDLGGVFDRENYIKKTRELLDSIDSNTPIVVISHSPFKEYAVCRNKDIGVNSNKIFSKYPNVKMYVHGHGHSVPRTKLIDNILCVTNPIVNNIYSDSLLSYEWEDLNSNSVYNDDR